MPTAPAAGIHRRDGTLFCDDIPASRIARAAGTPVYVYSASGIRAQYARLASALQHLPHRIHYSVKANSSLAVLALLRELGSGVDIVSGGELHRALLAGFRGADTVFSGVGKTAVELLYALESHVKLVNVESENELRLLSEIAASRRLTAPVALRINPEVTVDTPHPYTRTGERGMKFGIPYDRAAEIGALAASLPGIDLVGLDMHIGSQITRVEPYRLGIARLTALVEELRRAGISKLRYLDVGGGLGVSYEEEDSALDLAPWAAALEEAHAATGMELIVEPGRFLVGNAGLLLTTVLDRKHSGGKEFIVADAGMNDILRPSHYNAFHRVEAAEPAPGRVLASVVGPVCESGDFLALDRYIDDVQPGDILAVHSAGAYGFVMSSNYNSRPRAAEVLVDGPRFAVIRERETYDDLVRHEHADPAWRND